MFGNISFITFSISGDMRAIAECQVAPFPTVLTLRNARVHVHTMDDSYILSNIELAINDVLCCRTALGIPDVDPNHCHI